MNQFTIGDVVYIRPDLTAMEILTVFPSLELDVVKQILNFKQQAMSVHTLSESLIGIRIHPIRRIATTWTVSPTMLIPESEYKPGIKLIKNIQLFK